LLYPLSYEGGSAGRLAGGVSLRNLQERAVPGLTGVCLDRGGSLALKWGASSSRDRVEQGSVGADLAGLGCSSRCFLYPTFAASASLRSG
jgi:hypothetical protein